MKNAAEKSKRRRNVWKIIKSYLMITGSVFVMAVGVYFFKFPNSFIFGGVTGFATVIARVTNISASNATFWMNMILLLIGLIFLGKRFVVKTAYASILLSVLLVVFEKYYPMSAPLSNEPTLELLFAISLPAVGSAVLFNIGASSGGTDVIAMLLQKHTKIHIGMALLATDLIAILVACFVFDIKTALYSFVGLIVKSFLIDSIIEGLHQCKAVTIICDRSEEICRFIVQDLNRSATVSDAKGAYTDQNKKMIVTVLSRSQAVILREFIHQKEGDAFILIYSTSEIIGKGFSTI